MNTVSGFQWGNRCDGQKPKHHCNRSTLYLCGWFSQATQSSLDGQWEGVFPC